MIKNIRRYKEIKKIRIINKCLFDNIIIECKSQGKHHTEKNHAIGKSGFLKKIANKNQVMVFDIEQQEYYKSGGKLQQKNINKANRYNVLCGSHDKLLFNEIENGKIFDVNNLKQCFQLAFRAFIFQYSQCDIKENFDDLVPGFWNRIGTANNMIEGNILEKFKEGYENEKWEDIETKFIMIDRKINFISCFYTKPIFDIDNKYVCLRNNICFNIFPDKGKTIIMMSYFKDSHKSTQNYCEKIYSYYKKKDYKKITDYFNKIIVVYDFNISLNPLLWNKFTEDEQQSFYYFASLLKKHKFRKNILMFNLMVIIKIQLLKFKKCNYDIFKEL